MSAPAAGAPAILTVDEAVSQALREVRAGARFLLGICPTAACSATSPKSPGFVAASRATLEVLAVPLHTTTTHAR